LEPDWVGTQPAEYAGVSRSAWWTWTADATGWVAVNMSGAGASVGVYEGDALEVLRERQITNWWGRRTHSLFRAEAGHTYHLRLIGEGETSATLEPAPADTALSADYDLSGPLPVESSRWGLEPIPAGDLPEGAWGPGADGAAYVHGEWDCPHD